VFSLISHFFYYDWEDIENLPYTFYRTLLEQAFNLGALYRGTEFSLSSGDKKSEKLQKELAAFREFEKNKGK